MDSFVILPVSASRASFPGELDAWICVILRLFLGDANLQELSGLLFSITMCKSMFTARIEHVGFVPVTLVFTVLQASNLVFLRTCSASNVAVYVCIYFSHGNLKF
jgi:hypothetical protein